MVISKLALVSVVLALIGCATDDNPYNKRWREMGLSGYMVGNPRVLITVEKTPDGGSVIVCNEACRGLFSD